jgi:hypothetical protein
MLDRHRQQLTRLARKYGVEALAKTLKDVPQGHTSVKRRRGHPSGSPGDAIAIWFAVEIYTRSAKHSNKKLSKERACAQVVKTLQVLYPAGYRKGATVGRLKSLYYEARKRIKTSQLEDQKHIGALVDFYAGYFWWLYEPYVLPLISHRVGGYLLTSIPKPQIFERFGSKFGIITREAFGVSTIVLYACRGEIPDE